MDPQAVQPCRCSREGAGILPRVQTLHPEGHATRDLFRLRAHRGTPVAPARTSTLPEEHLMKTSLIALLLAASTLTACSSTGPYAFFRNPDEQRAINAAYTQE